MFHDIYPVAISDFDVLGRTPFRWFKVEGVACGATERLHLNVAAIAGAKICPNIGSLFRQRAASSEQFEFLDEWVRSVLYLWV